MKVMLNGQEVALGGSAGPDGNPVGTVISFMGVAAPEGYLVCDGAEYSIGDYPKLAALFREQFGAAGHFGGDGESTFAVPDMRNLFLRGYHGAAEDQMSGEVGEKQEATKQPGVYSGRNSAGTPVVALELVGGNASNNIIFDGFDAATKATHQAVISIASSEPVSAADTRAYQYTSRPVNMAVLYCIKAVESIPASGGSADETYSNEETRIGTWVDGKPLYRKVYQLTTPSDTKVEWIGTVDDFDYITNIYGIIKSPSGGGYAYVYANQYLSVDNYCTLWVDQKRIGMNIKLDSHANCPVTVVIEYTKTTD